MKLKVISDGTNAGTRLINEDTGEYIGLIQKIVWEAGAEFPITKTTIELLNVPVEIVTKANIDLVEPRFNKLDKSFEKEVRVISEPTTLSTSKTFIIDNQTQEQIQAVQEIKWEADSSGNQIAKIRKIKFNEKEWP